MNFLSPVNSLSGIYLTHMLLSSDFYENLVLAIFYRHMALKSCVYPMLCNSYHLCPENFPCHNLFLVFVIKSKGIIS